MSGSVREDEDQEFFKCHLVCLSIGTTIKESIATAQGPTARNMKNDIDRHRGRIGSRKNADKHLRTVFALQDGVTRSDDASEEKRNGTGFQDILEFYPDLADLQGSDSDAALAIVSGTTCILCNGAYMYGTRKSGEDSERELWFNEASDKSDPPNLENVIELDHCLKGTLITMTFTFNREHMERINDRAN